MEKFYFCKRCFKVFKNNKELVPVPEAPGPKEMKDRICIKCATMSPVNQSKTTSLIKSRYMNNTHTRNILSLERMAHTSRPSDGKRNNKLASENVNFVATLQNELAKTTPVKSKKNRNKMLFRKTKSYLLTKRNLHYLHDNEGDQNPMRNETPSHAINGNANHGTESTFTIPNIDVACLEQSKDHEYFNHEASEYGKLMSENKQSYSPNKSESACTDDECDYIKEDLCLKIFGDKDALSRGGIIYCKIHPEKIIEYTCK